MSDPGPDEATRQADEDNAAAPHTADRPPTPEEEAAAEQNELDPKVGEHYRDMAETGADIEGEGEIS